MVGEFTVREAASLASGFDPNLTQAPSDEQRAKAELICREISKAFDDAFSKATFFLPCEPDSGETPEGIFGSSIFGSLPSNRLIDEVKQCIKTGRNFDYYKFKDGLDDEIFSRKVIGEWFQFKRFQPEYNFYKDSDSNSEGNQVRKGLSDRFYLSDKLARMNQAAEKFWANAGRDDRSTHPDNASVSGWLQKHGFSETLASKAATIIRPEWAPTGRKPEE